MTQCNSFQSEVHDPGNTEEWCFEMEGISPQSLIYSKIPKVSRFWKWVANLVVNPDLNEQNTMLLFCSVTHSLLCLTLCDPMDSSMPGFPILHQLPELAQIHIHWISDAIQPFHAPVVPFLLLPLIFLNIRVFSNESALHIRWPRYWSFNFSISPSNEYSGKTSNFDYIDLCQQSDVFAFQYAV